MKGNKLLDTCVPVVQYNHIDSRNPLELINPSLLSTFSTLKEARVPPGPRLLILHHLDQFRNPSSVLKPALPLPPLPPTTEQMVVRR